MNLVLIFFVGPIVGAVVGWVLGILILNWRFNRKGRNS